jgi:hypothetical protein
VLERRAGGQGAPVERDAVGLGIRLGARLEPDLPVDGDAALREQRLSRSSRRDPRLGQDLAEANRGQR